MERCTTAVVRCVSTGAPRPRLRRRRHPPATVKAPLLRARRLPSRCVRASGRCRTKSPPTDHTGMERAWGRSGRCTAWEEAPRCESVESGGTERVADKDRAPVWGKEAVRRLGWGRARECTRVQRADTPVRCIQGFLGRTPTTGVARHEHQPRNDPHRPRNGPSSTPAGAPPPRRPSRGRCPRLRECADAAPVARAPWLPDRDPTATSARRRRQGRARRPRRLWPADTGGHRRTALEGPRRTAPASPGADRPAPALHHEVGRAPCRAGTSRVRTRRASGSARAAGATLPGAAPPWCRGPLRTGRSHRARDIPELDLVQQLAQDALDLNRIQVDPEEPTAVGDASVMRHQERTTARSPVAGVHGEPGRDADLIHAERRVRRRPTAGGHLQQRVYAMGKRNRRRATNGARRRRARVRHGIRRRTRVASDSVRQICRAVGRVGPSTRPIRSMKLQGQDGHGAHEQERERQETVSAGTLDTATHHAPTCAMRWNGAIRLYLRICSCLSQRVRFSRAPSAVGRPVALRGTAGVTLPLTVPPAGACRSPARPRRPGRTPRSWPAAR